MEGGSAGVGGNAAGVSDGKVVEGTGATAERDNRRLYMCTCTVVYSHYLRHVPLLYGAVAFYQ